jgi:plasmid maintenance system antidote protein VapI
METIRGYFQKAIEKAGSGNKLAAALKTTGGNITRVVIGAGFPGDETILRLAAYLGEDPQKLLLINQTERAPEAARPAWEKVFRKFAGAAVVIFCFASVLEAALPCLSGGAGPMYIMSNIVLASLLLLTIPATPADRIPLRA